MNLPKSRSIRSTPIPFALAVLALAGAGCVDQPAVGGYNGGYTGNQATVDDEVASVNYDYTLDGPRSVTIIPEKLEVSPGEEISVKIVVKNTGTEQFYAPDKLVERVALVSRYNDETAQPAAVANPAAAPVMLKCHAVSPGDSVSMKAHFTAGNKTGTEILSTNISGPGDQVQIEVK